MLSNIFHNLLRRNPFEKYFCVKYLSASCNNFHHSHRKKGESKYFGVTECVLCFGVSFALYYKRKRSQNVDKFCCIPHLPRIYAAELNKNKPSVDENSPRFKFNFLADVVAKTSPSVVFIEIVASHPITRQPIPISNGSGFIVKSDGLILTNAHVVSSNGRVRVKLQDGQEFEGIVESFDTESDLATVRIKANGLPVLPLGDSSKLRIGEFVIAMGNPLSLSHTITAGVISANRQGKELGLHKKSDYIQTDAAVNIGNSGGPLVNLDCEAIGINTLKVTEGISFAVPSDRAIEFLKRSEKLKGSVSSNDLPVKKGKRMYLGITMLTLSTSIIEELRQRNPEFPDVSHGVMVWRVVIGSPSYLAGIRHGDIITAINGKEIHSSSDIYSLLAKETALNIHVVRKKEELDFSVELLEPDGRIKS